eukprot:3150002-Rhodomonas_salina.2
MAANDPRWEKYHLIDGVLMWMNCGRFRIVVLPLQQRLLLAQVHDTKYGGHLGVDKTYAALAEAYYWPQMYAYVLWYVTTCNSCQLNKQDNKLPSGQLQPIAVPELPFLKIGLDFVGPLPVQKRGNNFLLTVTDYASRMTRFILCKSTPEHPISGQETANLFFKFIFRYHCLPAILCTDRGPQFTGQFFQSLFELCGTKQALGTAYHPRSQGLTKHANCTAIEGLRHYLNGLY